jgi:hypothetical protein
MPPHESPDIHPRAPKPPQGARDSAPASPELAPTPAQGATEDVWKTPERKAARGARPAASGPCTPDQLHICFNCAGELVYPLDWSEEGLRHWRIVLRCPDCESRREGVFEQAAVELLDDELDRAAGALLGDLRRMTHANMSEEVDFFIRALDADLIVPSDF